MIETAAAIVIQTNHRRSADTSCPAGVLCVAAVSLSCSAAKISELLYRLIRYCCVYSAKPIFEVRDIQAQRLISITTL